MYIATPYLNHSGDSADNPILSGIHHRVTLYKHDSAETLLRCWVRASGAEYGDLTARCTTTATTVYVDIVAGTDTLAGEPAVCNELHFTTTDRHVKAQFYVASQPSHKILLNGYDANDDDTPLIWPWYVPS